MKFNTRVISMEADSLMNSPFSFVHLLFHFLCNLVVYELDKKLMNKFSQYALPIPLYKSPANMYYHKFENSK
ncbi:hypothetical protein BBI08_08070 [Planococcus halocryophilus]|uniref:Uncharacterized protein n=1 Tax=Planococcus halocryophilus TaxID=1215089 RepID=A0A1C7DQD3_9BACL|nr:hypothetical protein BBI08_08070 [Planococcus halocryophilus]